MQCSQSVSRLKAFKHSPTPQLDQIGLCILFSSCAILHHFNNFQALIYSFFEMLL